MVTVIGARPQFIKAAPVSRAVDHLNAASNGARLEETLVHTGQHYDREMSQVFFEELRLRPPHHHLEVGSGSHGEQTGRMLERLEAVLLADRPDLVLVYGDTNSTLAGALAAAKLGIPLAHVEAGARSYRRSMPEEVNRVLTDHVADWLFCATANGASALAREGITTGVHVVGDVMYDAALQHVELARGRSTILARLDLTRGPFALMTVHRAENTDDPARFQAILAAATALARDMPVVWPVHPRARPLLAGTGAAHCAGLRLLPPVSYLDMLLLCAEARVVLTDSGGVQREAFFVGTPCVTLREETEWVETVETGWNQVVGTEPRAILDAARRAAPGGQGATGKFGDGRAAERIVGILTTATA